MVSLLVMYAKVNPVALAFCSLDNRTYVSNVTSFSVENVTLVQNPIGGVFLPVIQ